MGFVCLISVVRIFCFLLFSFFVEKCHYRLWWGIFSIYCGFGWAPCFCNNNTDIGDLSFQTQYSHTHTQAGSCATIWLVVNHKFARDHVKIAFSQKHVHAFNGIELNRKDEKQKKKSKQKLLSIYIEHCAPPSPVLPTFVVNSVTPISWCFAFGVGAKWKRRRAINWLCISVCNDDCIDWWQTKCIRKEIEMHEMTNIIRFTLTMSNPCAYGKYKNAKREHHARPTSVVSECAHQAAWRHISITQWNGIRSFHT